MIGKAEMLRENAELQREALDTDWRDRRPWLWSGCDGFGLKAMTSATGGWESNMLRPDWCEGHNKHLISCSLYGFA